jgi:hypothetical protein
VTNRLRFGIWEKLLRRRRACQEKRKSARWVAPELYFGPSFIEIGDITKERGPVMGYKPRVFSEDDTEIKIDTEAIHRD